MGRSQTQIEPRGSVSEKMDTHFQVKVCEWEEQVGLDGNFSVGEHLVGKRIVDVDESNEKSAIDSWIARTVSPILGIKRGVKEAMDQWWRRLHRAGHEVLKKRIQSLSNKAERLTHRWGGHVARLPTGHWLAEVLRMRVVQCWRWAQQKHTDNWPGVHPKRYKIFRWEDQLCRRHSEGCTKHPWENTGWWRDARHRLSWRRAEQSV